MTVAGVRNDDPTPHALEMAAASFAMLGSMTRLHIVWVLAKHECDVSELARRTDSALQAVSQHLAKLKLAGIVVARREGRNHIYTLSDHYVTAVAALMIERFSPQPVSATIDQSLSA